MTSLAVLRDGRLASGGGYKDKTIRVWDLGSGACDRILEGHTSVSESDVFFYCLYMGECFIIYS